MNMKQVVRLGLGIAIAISTGVIAGPLTIPNSFSAGTPARAAEVNANFNAVATAVNDNNSRLTTLEAQSARPDVAPAGNVVLGDSTPTSGNIMKGARTFLHSYGSENIFLGSGAGNFVVDGVANSAVGQNALARIASGDGNTALGHNALSHITSGGGNTAIGMAALIFSTTGSQNTAVGAGTMVLANGSGNAAVGDSVLPKMVQGDRNTALGFGALESFLDGDRNVVIGQGAGRLLEGGDSNIYVGNPGAASESWTLRIGDGHSRAFIAGIRGVTTASTNAVPVVIDSNGQLGTINSSRRFKEDIADMGNSSSLLMQLRPVTFFYRNDQNPKGRAMQYGLVAEEVAAVAPGLVAHSRDGEVETVFYEFLPPMLLNEFQKQQRTIDAQNKRLAQLEREMAALRKRSAN
jgi:hypothetical protein